MWRVLSTFGPKAAELQQPGTVHVGNENAAPWHGDMSSIQPKCAPRLAAHWPRTSTLQKVKRNSKKQPPAAAIQQSGDFLANDDYKFIRLLGSGGFGEAYHARRRTPGSAKSTSVVLKRMKSSNSHSDKRLLWARREADILSSIVHPHIVSFYHSFEEINQVFIEMEFCDSGDLRSFIRAREGVLLPERQIRHWFHQLCQAVAYIHDRNIIHRDIKSKNVFISERGRSLKLGDFGSAKCLLNKSSGQIRYSRTKVGTSSHHPPELCRNCIRDYGFEVDVWALGVLLFEMTTLHMPFQASDVEELSLKILSGKRDHNIPTQSFSASLHRIVDMLMVPIPEDRPTVKEVLDDRYFVTYKRFRRRINRRKARRGALSSQGSSNLGGYYHPHHFQQVQPVTKQQADQNHEALIHILQSGPSHQTTMPHHFNTTSGIASASGSISRSSPLPDASSAYHCV